LPGKEKLDICGVAAAGQTASCISTAAQAMATMVFLHTTLAFKMWFLLIVEIA
jgi:hypothetical protein